MADLDRRLMRFEVTPEAIASLGRGLFRVTANQIPDDARIVASYYDASRDVFGITVSSAQWTPIFPGNLIPRVPGPLIERVK